MKTVKTGHELEKFMSGKKAIVVYGFNVTTAFVLFIKYNLESLHHIVEHR